MLSLTTASIPNKTMAHSISTIEATELISDQPQVDGLMMMMMMMMMNTIHFYFAIVSILTNEPLCKERHETKRNETKQRTIANHRESSRSQGYVPIICYGANYKILLQVTRQQFEQSLLMMRNGCAPKFKLTAEQIDGLRVGNFDENNKDLKACFIIVYISI
uniref:Uncharacterized protein n=1 Tax=Glossina austeni TaxID=7395 RepID=A0A1A9UFW9_GLOAU